MARFSLSIDTKSSSVLFFPTLKKDKVESCLLLGLFPSAQPSSIESAVVYSSYPKYNTTASEICTQRTPRPIHTSLNTKAGYMNKIPFHIGQKRTIPADPKPKTVYGSCECFTF